MQLVCQVLYLPGSFSRHLMSFLVHIPVLYLPLENIYHASVGNSYPFSPNTQTTAISTCHHMLNPKSASHLHNSWAILHSSIEYTPYLVVFSTQYVLLSLAVIFLNSTSFTPIKASQFLLMSPLFHVLGNTSQGQKVTNSQNFFH